MLNFIIPTSITFYNFSETLSIKYAGLFAAIGFLVTICTALYINGQKQLFKSSDQIFDAAFVLIVSGISGARLFYVLTHLEKFNNFREWFLFFDGGLSLMGALFCSIITLSLYCKIRYSLVLAYLDFVAPLGALFQVFMRAGCLFCGCCHGTLAHSKTWLPTVTYTNSHSMAPTNTALLASQLYSIAASLLIFAILFSLYKKERKEGKIFALYCILEACSRFLTDFTRGSRETVAFNLTWAQISAMLLFALGMAILNIGLNKNSEFISTNKKQS